MKVLFFPAVVGVKRIQKFELSEECDRYDVNVRCSYVCLMLIAGLVCINHFPVGGHFVHLHFAHEFLSVANVASVCILHSIVNCTAAVLAPTICCLIYSILHLHKNG